MPGQTGTTGGASAWARWKARLSWFEYRIAYQADYATGWASSPEEPLMVRPFAGTFPDVANGPDELRPMPSQWPRATMPPFGFVHSVIEAVRGVD